MADAKREKAVLEVKIQEEILEEEGKKNVSAIRNERIKEEAENEANIAKYRIEKEAEANSKLFTEEYVKINVARSLSNNTKFYFSGDKSAMGSIFSKILGGSK